MSQPNDHATQFDSTSEKIDTVNNDIAENYCRERMRVNAPGRMTYQKILVQSTNKGGGKTTVPYDVNSDVPLIPSSSILPTEEELEKTGENSDTVLMLVSKAKEQHRKQRGILNRPINMIRAVIQAAQHSPQSLKFYVAIDAVDGLCGLRLIKKEAIFFYSEFLPPTANTTRKIPIRARQVAISNACRAAAAAAAGKGVSSGEGASMVGQDLTRSIDEPADKVNDIPAETTAGADGTQVLKYTEVEL